MDAERGKPAQNSEMDTQTGAKKGGRRAAAGQASHLVPTLEGLRNKLLDLTTRNNLLNLSLNDKRTRRLIRFVHSDLQGTLNTLCSGTILPLIALPDPPEKELREVNDDDFEAALAKARLEDPLYQQILNDSADDKGISPALASAEDRLRSQVREELESLSKKKRISPNLSRWAEEQGISSSYELPCKSSGRPRKSSGIQTLLLGARLERVAEAIRKQALSSIEETGNNILYLALGGLSWNVKDKELFAPLILLPVEVSNAGARGGARNYTLRAVDDIPIENVTLRERLKKDFSVELPELNFQEQSTDLASYLEAVEAAISDNPAWSVRRFMNLSLFSFSGLGLYKDLDPSIVQKSALVRQILSAETSSNKKEKASVRIADDESVDKPEVSGRVPVLITQADASQFAAIADVMEGKSLVIEGPPGTGKSQTITNIIANALYAGKRVLFVAEKKVALDVVYTRLSEAGLKDYCLRIASDKVNKRDVYNELAERLRVVPPLEKNRDSTADAFDELRDELNTFSTQLNRGFGADRKSYQALIWDELYLRQLLKDAKVSLSSFQIDIENAIALTRSARDRSSQIFEELAALKQETPLKRLADAFDAFSELPADVIERERLVALAHQWQSSLHSLLEAVPIEAKSEDITIQSARDTVNNLCESLSRLPAPIDHDLEWLVEPLSTREMQAHSASLLSAIAAERQSRGKLESLFHRDFSALPSVGILTSFLTSWRQWRLGDQGMPQTMHEREALAGALREINDSTERIDIIRSSNQYSEQTLCCSVQQIESLLNCIQRLADLPKEILKTRQFDLWSCNPTEISKYLNHHEDLERHRMAIGIHANHPVLGHPQQDLLKAASDLEQAEALGYSEEATSPEGIMAWRSRIEKLVQLIERVDGAFGKSCVAFQYEDLTIAQLAVIPDFLRDLKGLSQHIFEQEDSAIWSSSLAEVNGLRAGMKEILELESDLRSQSLIIPAETSFYVLQSAAKKIETTPWLLQAFDGEYSKAIERAKSLGAKGSATQQAKALRLIAQLLQLRETFPSQRFSELSATTSSFEESAEIIEQIEEFKSSLQRHGMLELLDFFKNTTSAEVERLGRIYQASVSADLSALLEQSWLGIDIGNTTYRDLHSVIQRNRDELALVERVCPYIALHGQAEGAQQSTPKAWIRAVADYISRLDAFPSSEVLALTGNQCTLDDALASMQALRTIQDGLGSWRLDDETTILIRSIPVADVQPLLALLRDQLLPTLRVFLELMSNQGVDIGTAQIHDLLEGAKQSRQSFLDLIQWHAELGIINDLSVEDLVSAPIDLLLHQKREQELESALDAFKQCGGEVLGTVSAHDLLQVIAWIEQLHNSDLPDSVVSQCLKPGSGAWILQQSEVYKALSKALQQEAEAAAAFIGKTAAASAQLPGSPSTFDNASADHLCQWLGEICALSDFFGSWIRCQELLSSLPSDAERELVQRLLESAVDGALWPDLYQWNIVRSRLIALTGAQPQLRSLRAADQVARRKRFAKTEDELRRLDRAEVIAAIHNDPDECQQGISEGLKGDFTEMALIRNESVKRIKHRPLRHLFQYAGNALRGLKPCWMMSPTTVASLLPRSKGEDFDLVVIDEASQMSPERALGVISRAKQCVVVGDPQQLPPTSLFQRNTAWEDSDDGDEVDTDVLEEESILDLSSKAFQPTRRLKWHYRSRNGSLIAFSNKHFYDSQLVVFLACRREFAITRHLVEEPRYKKGVNEPEVRDVCDIVIRQLELCPERTLGVVAMNEAQADAIAEQLDDLAFHHDELRRRLDLRDNSESLFVKPLEKVQGDERDTIVISTTYGPSEPGGTIPLRFGLLNRASGHRRLNVLFTRAKHAIELVTSLKSNQLRLPATAGPGLLALRDYLRYVEKGSVDSESSPVREPNTAFEKLVFGVLSRHGFTADCGVGFSNYFIDLAVRHPDAPDHYLLALEGDGPNYNSARAARDRDKYRQNVLEALGWNVYKVWSTDWFDNPEGESKKLLSQLKRLRKSVVIPCDHTEELRVNTTMSARPRDGNSPRDAAESSELPEPDPEPDPVSAVAGTSHEQSPISESDLSHHHQSAQSTECFVSKTSSPLRTRAQLPEPSGSTTGKLSPSETLLSIKEPEEDFVSSDSASSTQSSVLPTPIQGSHDSSITSPTLQTSTTTAPIAAPDLVLTSVKHSDTIHPKQPAKGVPTLMPKAVLAPGARIECRSAEWLVRSLGRSSDGQQVVDVVGVSAFLREKEARFLVEVERAAGSFKVLQPEDTALVSDPSPRYRDSLLFLEAHLRRSVATDNALVVGHRAAMDALPYQLEPAAKALAMPRQRLLIADAVGLGKTLECGILCSELIRRGRGKRLLVVTTKSMLVQFQKEFWTRFSIPLVRLDSVGIQRIREQIPTNQNPFHYYDKAIVSVDTLKNDRDYRFYLDNASWDIIVIDECQNVAERARGAQKSQRARLAERLATRSETLILLSATPHDGKPESFASLMNMLDPTAIADPSKYTKDDIKDLYVRRFRKDVIADLRSSVKERDTADVECAASEREERVFALLKDLKLPDSDAKAKGGQLFKTTLAKSLLSSPMAALETVRNRLKRLAAAASLAPTDQAALEELEPLLAAIGPADFSKYQRLLQLIRSDWSWSGKDPRDRIVLFTGRRETQRFLVEHLADDLGLPTGAVVGLDGAMPDVEQTRVVEQFAQEKEAVRILVATEVASEGLNLHYLSHRLVHVDIPWSLMTLQQRNGRIDRYGQTQQPQIRYLLSCSRSDGMGDAEKVLRLLKRKDEQAQQNIGDPAVFLGVYDAAGEEDAISEAFESGLVDELEQRMDANAEPYLQQGSGDSLFEELFGSGPSDGGEAEATPPLQVQQRQPFSLFPSLWSYVDTALEAVAEQMERRGEKLDLRADADQQRLEITPPSDLQRRYDRYPRELQPPRGQRLALSTEVAALQGALEQSRRQDTSRPELEYLWDLHPLVDWLADRGQISFQRHCAPVLQLSDGLEPGEVVMVFQGTIPNQKGMPVVQEWVAVRFSGTGLNVVDVEPFEAVAERLQLGRKPYANPNDAIPEHLRKQLPYAVGKANDYLMSCAERWTARMQPELQAQRERLKRLRSRQVEQLELSYASDQRPQQIKEKRRQAQQKAIDVRFDDHERFVNEVMTIEPAPYLKVVAVLHREA